MMMEWLKLPEARSELDDIAQTRLHAHIIQKKSFLKKIYVDFYRLFQREIAQNYEASRLVELGSGGGFIKEIIPNITTSDILALDNLDMRFSALDIPFGNEEVDAYFAFDVFHHLSNAPKFFREIERTLKHGGKIMMIEPANTLWGRYVYQNFHHEPFDPQAGWEFTSTSPLASANGALPWIVFYRDRQKFEREFPALKIVKLTPHTPFRYLLSGGLTFRALLPSCCYSLVKISEILLSPLNKYIGMFLTILLQKN